MTLQEVFDSLCSHLPEKHHRDCTLNVCTSCCVDCPPLCVSHVFFKGESCPLWSLVKVSIYLSIYLSIFLPYFLSFFISVALSSLYLSFPPFLFVLLPTFIPSFYLFSFPSFRSVPFPSISPPSFLPSLILLSSFLP